MVGVDVAGALIRRCRKTFRGKGIEFIKADALSLPFEDGAFDIVLTIETSCCVPDKAGFLAESLRVLRSGGTMVWVDFFYRRETSLHSLRRCIEVMEESGAEIVEQRDMREGILRSLTAMSGFREQRIEARVPRPLHGLFKDFSGTKESSLYGNLKEGHACYFCFALKKR